MKHSCPEIKRLKTAMLIAAKALEQYGEGKFSVLVSVYLERVVKGEGK